MFEFIDKLRRMSALSIGSQSEILRLTTSLSETFSASIGRVQMAEFRHSQSSNSLVNISDVKALEHPTLKVPYEILNKKFRSAQKNIDREVSHVQSTVADLENSINGDSPNAVQIDTLLNGVIDKLSVLKRKAVECINDELEAANVSKKRLDHLQEYCVKSTSSVPSDIATVSQWKKKRLDRMLVEHFLRCGYYDTALNLACNSEIEDLTNIELFLVSRRVEESLSRRETAKCLNWCYDNKSKLRKIKSISLKAKVYSYCEIL